MYLYYKATGSNAKMKPIRVRGYRRANDVAYLTLATIRKEVDIPRKELIRRLERQKRVHEYSTERLAAALTHVIKRLSRQGLVEILTFGQYVARGNLTQQQIYNFGTWLRYVGIFPSHKENKGIYSKDELSVFRKAGQYVSRGMPYVKAVRTSLRYVLGERKAKQFEDRYRTSVANRAEKMRVMRREKRAKLIRQRKEPIITEADLNICMGILHYSGYRKSRQPNLPHVHASLLERLVRDFPRQYSTVQQYPLNLYFVLSKKEPEVEIRKKVDDLMRSIPTQQIFRDYERAIFGKLEDLLNGLATKLKTYLRKGFRESEERAKDLAKIKHRGRKSDYGRYLEIVNARYRDSGELRTLENLAQEEGVEGENIRQLEAKGIKLLREQPTIQKLLSMEFWKTR